jgi:hypothetical protein
MGLFKKITKPFKKAAEVVTKPFAKVTNKLLPNELRFLAPYAAGIGTLMLPPGMGPLMRTLSAAGLNTAGQIAADESATGKIDDLNLISTALAGGLGYLGSDAVTGPGGIREGIVKGPEASLADIGEGTIASDYSGNVGFLQGAENVGREGVASLSELVQGGREDLINLGANPANLFKKEGAKQAAKALGPTLTLGSGDVAYEAAIDAQDAYNRQLAEEEAEIAETTTADEEERANLQMTFMRQAGIPETEVKTTLEINDLGDYYEPPVEEAANGGIMGRANFSFGGRTMAPLANFAIRNIDNARQGLNKQMEAAAKLSDETMQSTPSQPIGVRQVVDKPGEIRPGMMEYQAVGEPKQAEEFIESIRNPNTGGIDYKMAEMKIGTKLKGDETVSELVSMYLYKIRSDVAGAAGIAGVYGAGALGAMASDGPEGVRPGQYYPNYANGGITGLKDGGMLNFGGREMDLRTGGFVPIGKKERADDVPARLSKNEFVMTADAVRAAGGGSVNEGAKRMYEVMNNLEARA